MREQERHERHDAHQNAGERAVDVLLAPRDEPERQAVAHEREDDVRQPRPAERRKRVAQRAHHGHQYQRRLSTSRAATSVAGGTADTPSFTNMKFGAPERHQREQHGPVLERARRHRGAEILSKRPRGAAAGHQVARPQQRQYAGIESRDDRSFARFSVGIALCVRRGAARSSSKPCRRRRPAAARCRRSPWPDRPSSPSCARAATSSISATPRRISRATTRLSKSDDDCDNQRPLTDKGRAEAREIGAAFRELKIPVARVLASPRCRTMETAMLAFGRAEREDAARGGPASAGSGDRYASLRVVLSTPRHARRQRGDREPRQSILRRRRRAVPGGRRSGRDQAAGEGLRDRGAGAARRLARACRSDEGRVDVDVEHAAFVPCDARPSSHRPSAVRREYLPYRLHVLQLVEAGVHLVEPDVAVDQPVDRQAAFLVEADEARNVAHRHARSLVAAAYRLLLPDEIALVDAERRRSPAAVRMTTTVPPYCTIA